MQGMAYDPVAWLARLTTRRIGRRPVWLAEVDSTNRLALKLAAAGEPEGTVVIADRQTAGRGRLHRVWQSPPGCNLYLSILLRPEVAPAAAASLTLVAGIAVAETVRSFCPGGVALKWPNDVLIRGRKVAGILAEAKTDAGALATVVVGIGLNVNIGREAFAPAHRDLATSLKEETGTEHEVGEAAARLCERFEAVYDRYLGEGFEPLRSRWLGLTEMVGQPVQVRFGAGLQAGIVVGIDGDGALLLGQPDGSVLRVTAGDATVVKPQGGG
jgi:BirA family biotin operon repressor/biotin-[acetyl-CoA-carboxylase] ligase